MDEYWNCFLVLFKAKKAGKALDEGVFRCYYYVTTKEGQTPYQSRGFGKGETQEKTLYRLMRKG
ncbi:hypothetical protein RWV98_18990 [Agathobaculum sp. NTUH-O15-33]|uniref:hypothetical protein n=1 Tax=Agathobaculum sp. NTUH-O15-33 TaxID=3079302 RepID=UPI002958B456|nr:hypothetical protein [Agathobaculum sp. NTUH-O15-33]WNX84633.1 hypothetical protein RWV98_18990 [Agathobaculum sp. NTUH-O15-33]